MELNNIKVVAWYEAKLICRSFVFWVLCLLGVGGVIFLQYLLQCGNDNYIIAYWNWSMFYQPFSFSQVHAFLYNIVQAFMLIFVATEVVGREHRGGPLEALYVHPMSNSEYLFGKVAGVLLVFFLVGCVSMLVSCVLNILGTDFAPFNFLYYLYYFLTLTLPSLVFFAGLGVWLTWLVRFRVLSILLLLVYLYYSVTRLPGVFHGLFDFTGSGLSNVFSAATGHVDGWNYTLHRLTYLLTGVGCIFWTIYLQKRLPNNRRMVTISCCGGGAVLLGGMLLGGWFALGFMREEKVREEYRAAFARHEVIPSCRVTNHDIRIQQRGHQIQATSELTVCNPNGKDLSRFILYLNPGLKVESLEANGQAVRFTRDGQVISVERPLQSGANVKLTVRYGGEPDGRVCYLDMDDASYYDTRRGNGFFHLGRRHVLVSDASVVLVPEAIWYPVAVPPVNPSFPALTEREYTRYRLQVVNPVQPVVLSQGIENRHGDTIEFQPSSSLEGLSLCAGVYERKSVLIEGIRVEWYHFKGNDLLSPVVKELDKKKLVDRIVRSIVNRLGSDQISDKFTDIMRRRDWLNGEDSRLLLVEAPLSFVSHFRTWKGRSEYVQPGLVLLGERGAGMPVENYLQFLRNRAKYPEELYNDWAFHITIPLFRPSINAMQHPFLKLSGLYEPYTGISLAFNPYNINSLFFEPATTVTSSRYGMIDQVLKLIIAEKGNLSRWSFGLSRSNFAALTYLQEHTLEEASRDRSISSYLLNKMLERKTVDLLDRVEMYVSRVDYLDFLTSFYTGHHGEVPLDTLCSAIRVELGIDFESILQAWASKAVTSYQVQNIKLERMENSFSYVGHFQIRNTGKHPGRIMGIIGIKHYLELQPGESKQVRWEGNGNLFELDLGISLNIPTATSVYLPPVMNKLPFTRDTTIGVWDIPASTFDIPANEILVDNEDPGFRLIIPASKKLRDFFFEEQAYVDSFLGGAPLMMRWEKLYNFNYYGLEKRSAYVKTNGSGNFKAEWSADIPGNGTYEILVMHPSVEVYLSPKALYYMVKGEGKEAEEILLDYKEGEWVSLGQFDLKRGKSTVVLDDRAPTEKEEEKTFFRKRIIADAVKWVKVR